MDTYNRLCNSSYIKTIKINPSSTTCILLSRTTYKRRAYADISRKRRLSEFSWSLKRQYLHTEVFKILWKSLKDTGIFPNSYAGDKMEALEK